jgi:hypothetical protein
MAYLFNDAIDDQPTFDVCSSFEGGQVSNLRASLLQPNQAALMQNFDINVRGEAITRRGSLRLGGTIDTTFNTVKGLTFYNTPANSYLVAGTRSGPRYYNGTTWPLLSVGNPIGISGLTYNDVSFAQGINILYMADGFNSLYSWNGTTSTSLGGSTNANPPNSPALLCWHTDRLCAAGMSAEQDAIYFSQFLDGATWDRAAWQIRVGAGEGDDITGLMPWSDFNLVVFKRRSIWIVNCDPTLDVSQFEIKPITRAIGCNAPKTAAQVGDDIFFLSTQGVRSLKRTIASEQQQDIGPAVSQPIQDYIDRVNPAVVSYMSAGIHWNNRYILSGPLDGATTPNYIFVYSTLTNAWSGYWTGMGGKYFSSYAPMAGQNARMVFVTGEFVHEWLDYVLPANEVTATFQDNGTDIACRLLTRAMNFQDPISPKTGLSCEADYSSVGTLTAQLVKDGANAGSAVSLSSGQTKKAFDVQSIGQFRDLQIDFNSTAGKQTLRKLHASAFTESMLLQS